MFRKLKTLDKILLIAFSFIIVFGFISGFAVNRILKNLLHERAKAQIVSATELIGRTVATNVDAGYFRDAWRMIHLNVGKNNFTDFLLLDSNGSLVIPDIQSQGRILPLWKNTAPLETINNHTVLKQLPVEGSFISEFKYNNLGNSKDSYSLVLLFEDPEIAKAQLQITIYIFGYVSLLILFFGYILFFFRTRLLKAIAKVNEGMESIIHDKAYEDEGSIVFEYLQSKQALEKFTLEFKEVRTKLQDQVKIKILGDLTRQVAHDIRSPLSALNMVMHGLSEISEEKRHLIRNAVQRINDISNDLLQKGKPTQIQSSSTTSILLFAVIDSIVSEKRIQYRDKINIKIDLDFQDSFGNFVTANATELSRCISNLVNNSVESFENESGEVSISIGSCQKHSVISIKDNGKGISETLLTRLGTERISYGKENSDSSGSGLGIYHAKKTIEEWGGKFSIRSEVGVGTTVEIKLQISPAPVWFSAAIKIHEGATVITVDDDLSIHQIWKGRLESIKASEYNVVQKSFTSASDFLNYPINDSMIFLIDYEYLNQKENGLGLIIDRNIASRSILVTSRYEENFIRETCENLNIKLLPKQLSGFVPVEIKSRPQHIDYILIEDDTLVHMAWKLGAKNSGKTIKTYFTFEEFSKDAASLDKSSPVYIDVNLGNGVRGEAVSEYVFKLGFMNITLATGYQAEDIVLPQHVKKVIGKEFP